MANEEHLEILLEGVETWNKWRKVTPEMPNLRDAHLTDTTLTEAHLSDADLRGADLRGADLRGADVEGADLRRANLRWANVGRANLRRTDLYMVDLSGAKLSGAGLSGANLRDADLEEANLSNANLKWAILHEVNFGEAILTEATMGGTLFLQTILKNVKGLDTITHWSASNLDHLTIARSDRLPLSFLRGCGLPDLVINNIEVLRGDPFELYSCFISHSSNDQDFADRLYADLQDEGVRCWYAPQDLRGGEKTHRQIEEAIRHHDKLVLILSEASMESNWVEHEIREARERERKEDRQVLFPVSLVPYSELGDWELFDADEGGDLAREIREYYIPDFSDWKDHDKYSEAFGKLFRGLKGKS
jgi:hypothetical protein